MAEPFSIAASVITVVGAANRVRKGLHALKVIKDAPESLDDLLEEMSRLELVFETVKNAALEPQATSLLEKAQEKLTKLDELVHYSLTEAGEDCKADRWQWLRKGDGVEKLLRQLDRIRNDLTLLISVNSLSIS